MSSLEVSPVKGLENRGTAERSYGFGIEERTSSSAPDGPVDEEILAELLMVMEDGSLDGLATICDLFLKGVPDRLSEIEAALHEGRLDDAAKAAHSLKGTGGAFGARRLGELAGRLERACREMDGASAPGLLEHLHLEFIVFRNILQQRLAHLSPS